MYTRCKLYALVIWTHRSKQHIYIVYIVPNVATQISLSHHIDLSSFCAIFVLYLKWYKWINIKMLYACVHAAFWLIHFSFVRCFTSWIFICHMYIYLFICCNSSIKNHRISNHREQSSAIEIMDIVDSFKNSRECLCLVLQPLKIMNNTIIIKWNKDIYYLSSNWV